MGSLLHRYPFGWLYHHLLLISCVPMDYHKRSRRLRWNVYSYNMLAEHSTKVVIEMNERNVAFLRVET